MLNKLKFNNLVISNKKGIQEARIQTINKLVHKIRKLKCLLQKRPDDTKTKERIRKSTETMELLKKLKTMDVMKKVLLMDKPASAVITNGTSTPEEITVALLSMNKVMQCLVKRFKSELHLNGTENEWKQDLMESSKRKQKIERTEEKRRKRLELKEQKIIGRKRLEWLEENQNNLDENVAIDADCNVSTTGDWHIEELSNDTNKEIVEKIQTKSSDSKKGKSYVKKTSVPIKKLSDQGRNFNNKSFEEERNSDNEVDEIKELSSTIKPQEKESSNDTAEDTLEYLAIDPFFITETGEHYMSTSIIKKDTRNLAETPVDFRDSRSDIGDKNQKYGTQKNKLGGERNIRHNKEKNGADKFSQSKWNDNNKLGMRQQRSQNKKFTNNSNEKNLHPSWAAKQKLKTHITGFQGKKTTFMDEEFCTPNKLKEKNAKINKSSTLDTKSEMDSLHPSWAAKQKLKPSITAFQGKKITFDYDE